MAGIPQEGTKTGIIYHEILSHEYTPASIIAKQLRDSGTKMADSNVNAVLGMMARDNIIDREKINGNWHYAKKKNGKTKGKGKTSPTKSTSTQLALIDNNKTSYVPRGEKKAKMVEYLSSNIGVPVSPKQIAEQSGVAFNSSVGNTLARMEKDGLVERVPNPHGGRTPLWQATAEINNHHAHHITRKQQPIQQKPKGRTNLFEAFQQLAVEIEEKDAYRQALYGIVGILESVGIIETGD